MSLTYAAFPSWTLVTDVRSSRMIVIRAAGAKVATKLAKKEIHANCRGGMEETCGKQSTEADSGVSMYR